MPSDFFVGFSMNPRETSSPSLKNSNDRSVLYKSNVLIFVVLAAVASVLSAGLTYSIPGVLTKLAQTAVFLVLGYIHTITLHRNTTSFSDIEKWLYTLFLAVVIVAVGLLFHFILSTVIVSMPVAAAAAFVVPYLVQQAWNSFNAITTGQPIVWSYTDNLPLQKSTTFLNSMPVRFKLELNGKETRVTFRAPVRMKLGVMFYHMIQEQNANAKVPIVLHDRKENNHGWIFYTDSISGVKKFLDPEAGLLENGVKQNATITAKQVTA